jgi:hypothetical protein
MWEFEQSKLMFTDIQNHFPAWIEWKQRQFQGGILQIHGTRQGMPTTHIDMTDDNIGKILA